MAENKILPWAQSGTANVLSDDAYAADVAKGGLYGDGVKTGQASSHQANKTWRQATAPGSGLGQFLVDNLDVDVTDADTPSAFSTRIANAVLKLSQISPFNQAWAKATGGYRKYAIVSDSSGNYWSSTSDQNTTIPGTSGAKWQNFFAGYATEEWVLSLTPIKAGKQTGDISYSGGVVSLSVLNIFYVDVKNSSGTISIDFRSSGDAISTVDIIPTTPVTVAPVVNDNTEGVTLTTSPMVVASGVPSSVSFYQRYAVRISGSIYDISIISAAAGSRATIAFSM